jgi:serine/threonine-protein kinase
MAEVFVAESAGIEGFKKRVAIKRVLPHLSEKKRFISMFLDEARLSAQLSHSNCVQVFDIGVGDNAYFIVMEYVDGADLKGVNDYLKNNGRVFPVEIAVAIAIRICEGLAYAHELTTSDNQPLSIVHRDMSPPNVLITKHGEVKIVDFGLAKASSQLEKSEPGIIKGKFSYLSPEAARGEEVDPRTDIFAVGIILWELLSGKRLFMGDTDFATVQLVQRANIPPLSGIRSDSPPELDRILSRALAQDVKSRYATARDLGRDLTAFLYRFGKPVSAFDIAELVRGAMSLRKQRKPDKSSNIIDKLIEEALFEFTSLQDKAGNSPTPEKREELKLDDIGKWVDEVSASQIPAPRSDSETQIRASIQRATLEIGIGNLAALEDDFASPATPEPQRTSGGPPPAVYPVGPAGSKRPEALEKKGGVSPLVYVMVVVLLGALVAGAWFLGLIPH